MHFLGSFLALIAISTSSNPSGLTQNSPSTSTSPVSVLTWHNNVYRQGANLSETVLTRANVNATTFGKLTDVVADGTIYNQPLIVPGVIPNKTAVIFGTSHDSVYALDDQTGAQLWKTSLLTVGTPVKGLVVSTIPSTDVVLGVDDMVFPEIGITGTPVADPSAGLLFLCYATKHVLNGGKPTYHMYLAALKLLDGSLVRQVEINASAPGSGEGGNGTTVSMDMLYCNQRGALLLLNGVLYIPIGSHGDTPPFHGWMLAYNAGTFKQTAVLCTTPNATQVGDDSAGGGIWMGGDGPATDGISVYASTGNGKFDVNDGGVDYGDAVLRLNPTTLAIQDWFVPSNQQFLWDNDQDLGATGVMILPNQTGAHPHLLLAASKPGQGYVIDRDHMGGYNASADSCLLSYALDPVVADGSADRCFDTPAYYKGLVYYGIQGDHMKARSISGGVLNPKPVAVSSNYVNNKRGSTVSISANGANNGIVWSIDFIWDPTGPGGKRQTLIAYNSDTLATLYSSTAAGQDLADYTKFAIPTIANGRVYVGNGAHLTIFGLHGVKDPDARPR